MRQSLERSTCNKLESLKAQAVKEFKCKCETSPFRCKWWVADQLTQVGWQQRNAWQL